MVGFESTSNNYRFFDVATRKIIVGCDVTFNEKKILENENYAVHFSDDSNTDDQHDNIPIPAQNHRDNNEEVAAVQEAEEDEEETEDEDFQKVEEIDIQNEPIQINLENIGENEEEAD